MASIIVADEAEGRRNLLAGTLEREGYSVTRAGTLRQCEGTALATMPDVVLMDGEWKQGDATDAAARLSGDPEFSLKCRIVILSSNTGSDYLMGAAKAGVAEVMAKPVDMTKLLAQLDKHAKKLFVPPPAEIKATGGQGFFEVSVTPGDASWSLPILQELLGADSIDKEYVTEILERMGEQGVDVDIEAEVLEQILRTVFDDLVLGAEVELDEDDEAEEEEDETAYLDDAGEPRSEEEVAEIRAAKRAARRKHKRSRMVEAMERRAEAVQAELDEQLDALLEPPEEVAILTEDTGLHPVDVNALDMTRLSLEVVRDLLWEMATPAKTHLAMFTTQMEDATQMVEDCLAALPPKDEYTELLDDVMDASKSPLLQEEE